MHDESRQLRERHADLVDAFDRLGGPDPGGDTVVARTTTVVVYPGSAAAFYAVNPVQLGGAESEGAAATTTADTSRVFYARNLGSAVPPVGTVLVVHSCSGRWSFRWDG